MCVCLQMLSTVSCVGVESPSQTLDRPSSYLVFIDAVTEKPWNFPTVSKFLSKDQHGAADEEEFVPPFFL